MLRLSQTVILGLLLSSLLTLSLIRCEDVEVAESIGSNKLYPFFDSFDKDWYKRWIHSKDSKYNGKFSYDAKYGLKVPEQARHYGISALLDEPVDPTKGLVLQFQVKFGEKLECGGAYLKFLTYKEGFTQENLVDSTPYSIMFGPDKCGSTNKVHLILRHKSPVTGEIEEKHLSKSVFVDTDTDFSNLYTAVLYPDNNSYAVLVNNQEKAAGSLYSDFQPAINPDQEVDDPEDKKPADWVDTTEIPDSKAQKPEEWDEEAPEMIADPSAKKPEEWDEEEDGEWEAPQVKNPEFKGKWSAPMIPNPEYKGPWAPEKIPNPNYYDDKAPLSNIGQIGGVAIEIWTMQKDINFDNVLVSNNFADAKEVSKDHWEPLFTKQKEAKKIKDETKPPEEKKEKKEPTNINSMSVKDINDRINSNIKQLVKFLDIAALKLVEQFPQLKPAMPYVEDGLHYISENPIYSLIGFFVTVGFSLTSLVFILGTSGSRSNAPDQIPTGKQLYQETIDANNKENEATDNGQDDTPQEAEKEATREQEVQAEENKAADS